MNPEKLKRLLAGVSIVGLLSAGCSTAATG
ncbi:MAG: SbtA family thio(seleno)oxazole RiPP natural product precursor [Deltaproteobacteria bacterium]|nr:SbtA family thio(seleno)oxazole RiPP natural product precursor [Deltaproteobacteria bacterium]